MTSSSSIDPSLISFLDELAELLAQAVMEDMPKKIEKEIMESQSNE